MGSLYPPDIRYSYMISLNPQAEPVSRDYYWALSERKSDCSAICLGNQVQPVVCVDSANENEVDAERCRNAMHKPEPQQHACNTQCILKLVTNVAQTCSSLLLQKLEIIIGQSDESFLTRYISFRWVTELASECSANCGEGQQHQRSYCVQEFPIESRHSRVDDGYCNHLNRPPDRVSCYKDCAGRSWTYTEWSECTVTCGGGASHREALCVDNSNQQLDPRYCESLPKDSVARQCNTLPCPRWNYGHWSQV